MGKKYLVGGTKEDWGAFAPPAYMLKEALDVPVSFSLNKVTSSFNFTKSKAGALGFLQLTTNG